MSSSSYRSYGADEAGFVFFAITATLLLSALGIAVLVDNIVFVRRIVCACIGYTPPPPDVYDIYDERKSDTDPVISSPSPDCAAP